ncbi:MAG: hypothetical protein COA47_00365 [Robiginitomaculum sp.]|nr:MAG: hypothetical protein COA47_00365 [Robiginitomaculum sp.]
MNQPDPILYIDADACPVRGEVFKVAARHSVPVVLVSNTFLRIPRHPLVSQIVVAEGPDVADDYIAERVDAGSIVITADILLAERCLKSEAIVLAPNGKPFTKDSIGGQVATRALMNDLRVGIGSENIGGPAAFTPADRNRFLQNLHEAVVQLLRR